MKHSTEFITQVTELFVVELETQLEDQPDIKVAGIEGAMREMLREVGAQALSAYLSGEDALYPEAEIPCPCGQKASYQFRRSAQTLSVFGWAKYRRAYYLCPECHQGLAPLDQRLGLGSFTPKTVPPGAVDC